MDNLPNELETEPRSRLEKNQEPKKNKKGRNLLVIALLLLAWIGILYFGFSYAKNYMDSAITEIKEQNENSIAEIKEDAKGLQEEIKNLRQSMENAGLSITNSSGVQERIDEKLKALDNQMKKLENSLRILKEAP